MTTMAADLHNRVFHGYFVVSLTLAILLVTIVPQSQSWPRRTPRNMSSVNLRKSRSCVEETNVDLDTLRSNIRSFQVPLEGEESKYHFKFSKSGCQNLYSVCQCKNKFTKNKVFPLPSIRAGKRKKKALEAVQGGLLAPDHAVPWLVLVIAHRRADNTTCHGVIVSFVFVLTAAHCLDYANSATIYYGAVESFTWHPHTLGYTVDKTHFYPHPTYKMGNIKGDIALIHVIEHFNDMMTLMLNPYVAPACISSGPGEPGMECFSAGWGSKVPFSNLMPSKLYWARMGVYWRYDSKLEVYARFTEWTSGLCNGDDGTPLICNIDGVFRVFGLFSSIVPLTEKTYGCDFSIGPLVFTDINAYMLWFNATMDEILKNNVSKLGPLERLKQYRNEADFGRRK